jgi:beta-ribofuranosylaminobenzene 5'-phosphate synthase
MSSADPPSEGRPVAVEVRAPTRIHLGMFSFGVPEVRSFGGVGVMIDRPGVHVRLRRAEKFSARGPLAERALEFAEACVRAWELEALGGCAIEVILAPASHAGLGSGTQLGMAVAAGVRHLFRTRPADVPSAPQPALETLEPGDEDWLFDTRDAIELARAVGRGRRSCIGVHGFSRGGLIVEAGRSMGPAPEEHDAERRYSPMVARVRLPSAWRCITLVKRDALGLFGEAEKEAFKALPPVPLEVSAELARIALMDLIPAAVESRFAEFSDALHRYGLLAGKPFEPASARLPHAAATAELIELLAELGIRGAAQSSWGPAVMACCESLAQAGNVVDRLEELDLHEHYDVFIARFDTQGAVLRELSSPDRVR